MSAQTYISEDTVFDRQELLDRVDGDWDLLREVVGIFAADSVKLMAEIRDAISREDHVCLNHAAHTLKGAVSNFSVRAPFELSLKLEVSAKSGEFTGAWEGVAALEMELEHLNRSLALFVKGAGDANTDCRG